MTDDSIRDQMFQGCDWTSRLLPPQQIQRVRLGGESLLGEQMLIMLRKLTMNKAGSIQ